MKDIYTSFKTSQMISKVEIMVSFTNVCTLPFLLQFLLHALLLHIQPLQMYNHNPIPNIGHRNTPQRNSMSNQIPRSLFRLIDLSSHNSSRIRQGLLESNCCRSLIMRTNICTKPSNVKTWTDVKSCGHKVGCKVQHSGVYMICQGDEDNIPYDGNQT